MSENRSVSIGRDASANVVTTGDQNQINAKIEAMIKTLPPPADVNLAKELGEIRAILERIGGEHAGKIRRALDDAAEEAHRPQPNKDEVGTALIRALDYAKAGTSFAEQVGKLAPHLSNAVACLGSHWHQLLSFIS
jgi:succinate dehydrogenase/fumarate reductase flavoprotein subunit